MFKKTIFISALTAVAFTTSVYANQGSGKVNFKGTVINAPCGIDPDSVEQTIDFGQLSTDHLNAGNTSNPVPFSIKLINCNNAQLKTVTVAFAGSTIAADTKQLGTTGLTNTAIKVSNQDGSLVSFDGKQNNAQSLIDGNNTLHFSSWVEAATDGTAANPLGPKTVAEGQFTAVANFNLTYP